MDLLKLAQQAENAGGLPPVEKWNPPHCGDIGMKIARDGVWYYQGSPIGRKKLTRLFSTILRRDADDKHYLVTPVEKIIVEVEDAPFLAVELEAEGAGEKQKLYFRTNVDDVVMAGTAHPLRFEIDPHSQEPSPYIHIRGRLEALINRAVFYHLVELGSQAEIDGAPQFGIWSDGTFFPIAKTETLSP